ncbi:HEAT repeat domain-containing protein [Chitinophaga arvensicola]|uniref:HEAT repeat-containing protein n=1 Tax=Chitinophaga arvensicola TaxID=29529 RepID=A0A1I0RPK5_9BACT|nr:HEAT repeat domain-containing protein [Chitinophaga arvensicola]SEW43206.1 hypothetical protein SAMN04488122_3188 [Chitinophaga arvensicola]
MKRLIFSFTLLFAATQVWAQAQIKQPGKLHASAVAIVVDETTYRATQPAIDAYKNMLETKEGLSAYLVVHTWKDAQEVKDVLQQLYKKPLQLEGAVLIGNIPVPMIRNAQHLTTALKIDELKYDMERSSVASDRFYDDLHLQFRFVSQDEKKPLLFYYELTEQSPQVVHSDFYSARISPNGDANTQYAAIRDFLAKAVAARDKKDTLDHVLTFAGPSYNSESLSAWLDENDALKEVFPLAWKHPYQHRHLNYRMEEQMKFRLLSELQRPQLDLAIFTNHGLTALQHVNGIYSSDDASEVLEHLQLFVRADYRKLVKRGQEPAKVIATLSKRYNVTSSWFDQVDSLRVSDSLAIAATDIVTADMAHIAPQPRMMFFNACGNAAFHEEDNLANAYLFNKGNTVVAHGNTINVLQDKWLLQQLGALSYGVRAGIWATRTNTLESQLIGDPTFHFANPYSTDLNKLLLTAGGKLATWQQLLKSSDPALQAVALSAIYRLQGAACSPLLAQTFRQSASPNVRMQCLTLLAQTGNDTYRDVLELALKDNYELIRRKASDWIAKDGSDRFIAPLVQNMLERPDDERIVYTNYKALALMDWDKVKAAVEAQTDAATWIYNVKGYRKMWLQKIQKDQTTATTALKNIQDPNQKESIRWSAIRSLRNGNYHKLVPALLEIAKDNTQPVQIRTGVLEALGWFSTSYQKPLILEACEKISKDNSNDEAVIREAVQTRARLTEWTLF